MRVASRVRVSVRDRVSACISPQPSRPSKAGPERICRYFSLSIPYLCSHRARVRVRVRVLVRFGFALRALETTQAPERLVCSCDQAETRPPEPRQRRGAGWLERSPGQPEAPSAEQACVPVCVWEPEAVAPEPACIQLSPALLDDVGSHECKCRVDAGDSVAVLADAAS